MNQEPKIDNFEETKTELITYLKQITGEKIDWAHLRNLPTNEFFMAILKHLGPNILLSNCVFEGNLKLMRDELGRLYAELHANSKGHEGDLEIIRKVIQNLIQKFESVKIFEMMRSEALQQSAENAE